jgi:hypothetical protein
MVIFRAAAQRRNERFLELGRRCAVAPLREKSSFKK